MPFMLLLSIWRCLHFGALQTNKTQIFSRVSNLFEVLNISVSGFSRNFTLLKDMFLIGKNSIRKRKKLS